MSVGTIVTIVLLMSVLVLGIFLVQEIFSTSSSAIDQVDQQIQGQINELFAEEGKKVVTYPQSRQISVAAGESGGFAFSVRNTGTEEKTYSYTVNAEVGSSCKQNGAMTNEEAEGLIELGGEGNDIRVASGNSMNPPRMIRLNVPEDNPLCSIRYTVQVEDSSGELVAQPYKDVEITSGGGLF